MLRSWRVENFKSIKKAELQFGKINLIVGANSIGKSSLVQSIVGFAQLGEQITTDQKTLSLNGPSMSLGSASGMTHHSATSCSFYGHFSSTRFSAIVDNRIGMNLKKRSPRDYDFTLAERFERVAIVGDDLFLEMVEQGETVTFTLSDPTGTKVDEIASLHLPANDESTTAILRYKSWINNLGCIRYNSDSLLPSEQRGRARGVMKSRVRFEAEVRDVLNGVIAPKESATTYQEFLQSGVTSPDWTLADRARGSMDVSAMQGRVDFMERLERDSSMRSELVAHFSFLANRGDSEEAEVELDRFFANRHLPIWRWLANFWTSHRAFEANREFAKKVTYLGPLRVVGVRDQKNYRSFSSLTPLGSSGEHLAYLLLNEGRVKRRFPVPGNSEMEEKSLIDALEQWNQFLSLNETVSAHGDEVVGARIQVGKYSLDNVGTGISQVTPVVALALWAASEGGKTVVLEQPELHLHPSLQRKLADFVFELSRHDCQFVIETHSEYLVTRLRLLRARGDLSGHDLRIFFAESAGSGGKRRAEFRTIDVGDKGYLSDWPEGFLDGVQVDQHAIAAIQMLP